MDHSTRCVLGIVGESGWNRVPEPYGVPIVNYFITFPRRRSRNRVQDVKVSESTKAKHNGKHLLSISYVVSPYKFYVYFLYKWVASMLIRGRQCDKTLIEGLHAHDLFPKLDPLSKTERGFECHKPTMTGDNHWNALSCVPNMVSITSWLEHHTLRYNALWACLCFTTYAYIKSTITFQSSCVRCWIFTIRMLVYNNIPNLLSLNTIIK